MKRIANHSQIEYINYFTKKQLKTVNQEYFTLNFGIS